MIVLIMAIFGCAVDSPGIYKEKKLKELLSNHLGEEICLNADRREGYFEYGTGYRLKEVNFDYLLVERTMFAEVVRVVIPFHSINKIVFSQSIIEIYIP
jgi:hypothetical protein